MAAGIAVAAKAIKPDIKGKHENKLPQVKKTPYNTCYSDSNRTIRI